MTSLIRAATRTDIPALREMLAATWHATYDATLGAAKVDEISSRWHSLEKLMAEVDAAEARPDENALLIAMQGLRIVGSASAHCADGEVLDLARLYIAPECQRGGMGTALLEAVLTHFPGSRTARLEVEPRNAGAIAFYRRHGFQIIAQGDACGGDQDAGVAHLVMEMPLPRLALRPAHDSDAQDLFGLLALCFAEYPGCYVDPHDDLPDLVRPGHWHERCDASGRLLGGEFWVLEDARGRVCACVAVDFPGELASQVVSGSREANSPRCKTAELHRLYVRPDCRRRGIAARLVGHVESAARQAGAGAIILWSDTRFVDAHRLYARLGYDRALHPRVLADISGTSEFGFHKTLDLV